MGFSEDVDAGPLYPFLDSAGEKSELALAVAGAAKRSP
jgi:hypothetical protein